MLDRSIGMEELIVIQAEEDYAPREKGGFVSPGQPS